MSKKIVVLLFVFIGFLQSCNTTEPPPPGERITLTLILEDVSSIEAWVTLTTTNLQLPTTITLKQNDQTRSIINLVNGDTLLYIDSLLPNQTYSFHTTIQPSSQAEVKSNVLNVTTMDTTSHDFIWQTFTFGEHSSSVLRDVAIIDENNIIVVGGIFLNDSLGQPDPQAYGIAKWDGQTWELMKLFYNTNLIVAPIRGILVLSPNEIYLAAGSIFRWDGISSTVQLVYSRLSLPDPNGTIEKLWGSSSSSIYGVGNVGSIVFYNSSVWTRIESGTNLNIGDIWGVSAGDGDYRKFLAAVDAMLVIDTGNNLTRINVESGHSISSIWGMTDRLIYTAGGSGLSLYKNHKWEKINRPDLKTIYNIRGQRYNDVFGISSTRSILHFNGYSWKSISELPSNVLLKLEVKDDLVAVVGRQADAAAITIIRRN